MSRSTSPPVPNGLPLIGNGIEFARDPVGAMERWADHGDVVRIKFPGQSMYMVTGPAAIADVLVNDQDRFTIGPIQRRSFSGIADHAVTTSTGEEWQRLRRAFMPAFDGSAVAAYRDAIVAETLDAVERWDEGDRIDLLRELRLVTLRILAGTLVGIDVRGDEDVVMDASDALVDRANFRRVGTYLPDWVPSATERRFRRSVTALESFVGSCLDDCEAGAGEDVASVLLAACDRGVLSRAEVRHNLVAILLAGNSSPAVALTHALHLLADHPEVRRAVADEYAAATAEDPMDLATADLDVTEDVVSEALRIYPPTVGVNREATAPVTVGGHEFDAGAQFLLPQWVPHRDERFWDAPEAFDPSRWRGDADRPEFAYFPFSGGPRYCPGMGFARQEMTLALATVVGRFDLDVTVDGPLTFTPSMTLRPATEITATVHRR